VNPVQHSVQPYGEVTATYNFASRAIDRHLDRSVTAYGNWKQVQEGDAARGMEVLHTQVLETVAAQESRLKTLQQESEELAGNLKLVADADTSAALDFRNQLTATQLLLEIEIGDASFRLERLRAFLVKNY
jgi:cell division protein FtsB